MTIHETIQEAAPLAVATIPASELRTAARRLREHTTRWMMVPALGYVLLTMAPGRVTMQATDLDAWLTIGLEAEVTGECTILLRAAALAAFASAASGPVTITVANDGIITLRDGDLSLRYRQVIPSDDMPAQPWPPESGKALRWSQSQDSLRRMLGQCRHCISSEETRYYLNGVFLTTKPGADTLRAVATDGHRMAVIDTDINAEFPPTALGDGDKPTSAHPGVILPHPIVKLLMRLTAPGGNEPVEIDLRDLTMRISVGATEIVAKMIDGTYPDYTRVMPPASDNVISHVTGAQITRIASVAAAVDSGNRSHAAQFDPVAGTISVRAPDGDMVSIPATITIASGTPAQPFGFSLRYIRDQARVTPVFRMHGSSPGDPFVIQGEDPDATYILMPMRLPE